MGIYDREYYRGETRGNLWLSGAAPVCRGLIIANVAIFVLESLGLLDRSLVEKWFAATGYDIFWRGFVWQLVTAAFLHGDLFHLLGNMLILWFVGREMEAMYGSRDFAALYFSAAIISMLGCAAVPPLRRKSGCSDHWGIRGDLRTTRAVRALLSAT